MKVVWSRPAVDQAARGFASIVAQRPVAAQRRLDELISRTSSLARFPDMGRVVPELGRPSIREVLVAPYRLIYRRDELAVVVLAIRLVRREIAGDELEG
ncbi:MAG: type II toxin-antitoxin system RelE/ParE family toxin [Thermoleophilia bacterium]|nr:type II toxin-antitoxin system RelE/ParE family toxin [Thermoleophilia bacterium]